MPPRIAVMKKPKDAKGALRRILRYITEYKKYIVIILICCFTSNILNLLGPKMAGYAINEAAAGIGQVNFEKVYYYANWMLICYVSSSLITIAVNVMMMNVSRWIGRKMRRDVFEKLMRLPVGFFDRNLAGDIISRVSYDIDVITTCVATDVVQIMTSTVMVIGSLVMMITISPLLSLIVLVTIPMAIGYTMWMRKRTQPRYSIRSKNYGIMNGFVEEMLSGQKSIQAYAFEDEVGKRFDKVNTDAADGYYNADFYGCAIGPTNGMINNLSLALIGMFGSALYMFEMINLGSVSSFILYSRKFSGPINEISNIINELFSALAAAERVFKLLDEEEEVKDVENAGTLDTVNGHVEVDHVCFGYDEDRIILHDMNLDAAPGKLTAIVGPTGAGKTTIINLLMRFYDVNSGEIRVDGRAIRSLKRSSLRKAYAMVLQDTWVFNGTIFDNIAYGKENATMDEVVAAAKAAHIHSFIMRLPEGYQTMISEDGSNISKGQKQLLTIARAMLYDAKMLILDEATSNVDTGTERQVQKAMRELMHGKTCFVIAHRLSTIQHADHILVIDHGDVVESGTHETLMKKKGLYHKLYYSQFE